MSIERTSLSFALPGCQPMLGVELVELFEADQALKVGGAAGEVFKADQLPERSENIAEGEPPAEMIAWLPRAASGS